MNKYTIGLLVKNRYGVLGRISSMFSRRGFNIDSLTVGETAEKSISRMTITMTGNSHDRDQLVKQLAKLHDVIKVKDMTDGEVVSRELVIIKVRADRDTRQEILSAASVFRANVVDYSPHSMMLEITGTEGKINALVEVLKDYGLMEIARTGLVAVEREANDQE